jgi:hypothetical protein
MKIITFQTKDVQLMFESGNIDESLAQASISLNPNVTWVKLILTDDKPNANGHRTPKEEFANIAKTALYMPIKLALGEIKEDHDDAFPIGVMAHILTKDDHIEALAALWTRERREDVAMLKQRFADGQDINVSWEITYDDAKANADLNCEDLVGCAVNAATIVGIPAYMGRTSVTQMASVKETEDKPAMDMIELAKHEEIVTALKADMETLKQEALTAKSGLESVTPELEELRKFKKEFDAAKARVEKIKTIRDKFTAAGLELDDEYFTKREDTLAAMEDSQLDFLVQELLAFKKPEEKVDESSEKKDDTSSITSNLPKVNADKTLDKAEIVKVLKAMDKKR